MQILWTMAGTAVALLLFAGLLHALRRFGSAGRSLAAAACRAPTLDAVVFVFTALPQIVGIVLGVRWWSGVASAWFAEHAGVAWSCVGPWAGALLGFFAALAGQLLALWCWMRLHELAHRGAMEGPRIKKTLNQRFGGGALGAWRNYLAVWWTMLAVPIFTLVRLGEIVIYPPLTRIVRLPRYDSAKWVNVSRHKFDGLVGADRIWCLYCDWMTGVWSLGSEMLRNIESYWCPIRFASPEKCENCRLDFPDVEKTWAPADGTMRDVTSVLEKHYPGPDGTNSWHGHPSRSTPLTVRGKHTAP